MSPRIHGALLGAVLGSALVLMGCDTKEDFADSVSGPGVDVHCFNAAPNRPAIGDTSVDVNCPTGLEPS